MASATVASRLTAAISRSQRSSTPINTSFDRSPRLIPTTRWDCGIMLTPARMSRKLKRTSSLTHKPESAPELSFLAARRFGLLSFKNLPILHHELYALQRLDVAQRISAH